MKTPDGIYDALPFIDLREYGNTDYQQWLHLDQEIEIPLTPNDPQYQVMCLPLRCLIFIYTVSALTTSISKGHKGD